MRFQTLRLVVLACFVQAGLAAPTLTGVSPSSGTQGATLNLKIAGSDFATSGAEVLFSGSGVIVNSVRVESPASIIATVTLLGDPGMRAITVVSGATTNSVSFEILPSPLSNPKDAFVTQLNGPGESYGFRDARGSDARLGDLRAMWSDGTDLYFIDGTTIRKISLATADVITLAGKSGERGTTDGVGANARFSWPTAVWGDAGNLYVADDCNIRKIVIATRQVTTFARLETCSSFPAILTGDGIFLYAVPGITNIRFSVIVSGMVQAISLATGESRSIPLPLLPAFQNSGATRLGVSGMWRLDRFLYLTWPSQSGALAIGRLDLATNTFEPLFTFERQACCGGFVPIGSWFDGRGNFYFAERSVIRRLVLATGALSTIAALNELGSISSLWGASDNLFIGGPGVISRIRIATREVSVLAGRRIQPILESGLESAAGPLGGAWGEGKYLYATAESVVNRVDLATNTIEPFVTGFIEARGIWGDGHYLYVAESARRRIQRIAIATREVTTLAGGLVYPIGVWGDATHLYVTDDATVRRIKKDTGETVTFAGAAGQPNSVDGIGNDARFRIPQGIWGDGEYLYVGDGLNVFIRRIKIATAGVTTLPERRDGASGALQFFYTPINMWGDGESLYYGDGGFVRRMIVSTGEVTPFAAVPSSGLWGDEQFLYGVRASAVARVTIATKDIAPITPLRTVQFSEGTLPSDRFVMSVEWGDGEFIYGISGQAIYKTRISTGEITHVAGAFNERGLVDAVGNKARFSGLRALWGDGIHLYVADYANDVVRRINIQTAEVSTVASVRSPSDMWGDTRNLYITRFSEGDIVRIALTTNEVTAFGEGIGYPHPIWGDGTYLYGFDTSCTLRRTPLTAFQLSIVAGLPQSCTVGGIWGNGRRLFIASSPSVRTLNLDTGQSELIAGSPTMYGTENGLALQSRFGNIQGLWSDGTNLYVSSGGIRNVSLVTLPHTFSISSTGSDYLRTPSAVGSVNLGYGRLQASAGSAAPDGVAIFSFRSNGVLVSEAAVPASPLIQEGRIYAETSGAVKTGIAIANPNDRSATISFYFTDVNGASFGAGTTTIAPNQQIAAFLDEAPFNGAVNARSFTFSSSLAVGAIALRGYTNERSDFLMTTLPVAPISSSSSAPVLLPHFATGGGWTTQVLLVNPTDGPISGGVEMDAAYNYSIAPRSAVKIVGSGITPQLRTGSIRVSPAFLSRTPAASTVFSYINDGITLTESGVATTGTASSFRLFAEFDFLRSMQTGIAVANTTNGAAAVQFELLDLKGQPTGYSGSLTIAGNGSRSLFLTEIPGFQNLPSSFRGVLRISSGAAISAIGLRGRYNERGDFLIATTPALAENSQARSAELIFPHIVSGGGYTTEFLLMSRGTMSSGNILLRSQSGAELPLPLAR